jgi:hypothetical protein
MIISCPLGNGLGGFKPFFKFEALFHEPLPEKI